MDTLTDNSQADSSSSSHGRKDHDKTGTCCKGRVCQWLCSTNALLYFSHGLSAWGDRMWQFAVGMFLVELDPTSLRLTAIYGFTSGGAILLLGALVGNWVDKSERLHVARTAIIINNVSVGISAAAVCVHVWYDEEMLTVWDGWLSIILQVVIIGAAVVADVAGIGRTISIERDWIVVICEDTAALTDMSAFLRRLDLLTNLAAPIVTGQIMTFGSIFVGAVFIAGWNVISMMVEYGLLYGIYKSVPGLAKEKAPTTEKEVNEKSPLLSDKSFTESYGSDRVENKQSAENNDSPDNNIFHLVFDSFITFYRGWKLYIAQPIFFAGLGLATVYMTVLGFDNITTGFAKEQGLSESVISILLAISSIFGVLGTVVFPGLRKRVGLTRTGLIANSLQFVCLAICVVSVFVPGSPFDPTFMWSEQPPDPCTQLDAGSRSDGGHLDATGVIRPLATYVNDYSGFTMYSPIKYPAVPQGVSNVSLESTTWIPDDNCTAPVYPAAASNYLSISLLMGGIVISRTGLWMFDLTVTQLLLETPPDAERGIVNGVQNSLNKFMDIIKSILVIVLPWPQTFGYLVILSFVFTVGGGISYAVYSRKVRGHLFHFEALHRDVEENRYEHPELRVGCILKE